MSDLLRLSVELWQLRQAMAQLSRRDLPASAVLYVRLAFDRLTEAHALLKAAEL